MGDGTDLNVTAAIGNRGATLVSAARRGLFVEVSEGASTNTYLKGGAARAAARALYAASFPSCAPRGRRVFPRFDPGRHGPLHPVQIGPKPKNAHPFGRKGTTPHHYM